MVKYCQNCGNPSYDGATICGNCGSKFPPKSDINSKPPVFNTEKDKEIDNKPDFNFSKSVNGLKNSLSKKMNEITVDETTKTTEYNKSNLNKVEDELNGYQYTKSSVIGFKEKDKGSKDPARKFRTTTKTEEPINKVPKKERKIKTKDDKEKIDSIEFPNINPTKINIKSIAIIAIVIIILIAIVGASIISMNNTSSDETLYFSDEPIGFYYPGNWSMYNNTGDTSGGEIAFKTPDKVLIGYTKVNNAELTLSNITNEINATAQSLGGSITQYKDITIDGIAATDITISSTDHGYSRYISIIHNGVYYSFVITNGQTSNPNDASSLTSIDIQNMIQSIKFADLNQTTTTQV